MKKTGPEALSSYVYGMCKDFVSREYREEEPYFETVWQAMDSLIQKWSRLPPEEWPLGKAHRTSLDSLGILGPTKEFITPVIIAVVSASIFHVWGTKLDDPERQISSTIEGYAKQFGLEGKPKELLKEIFPGFLRGITEKLEEIDRPWFEPPKRMHSAKEVLDPQFEFDDELEIGWEGNRPSVKVNGEKIDDFSTQEALFATTVYLAGARKTSEGWIHRNRILDEGGHRISDLRRVFSKIEFIGIPHSLRQKIIRSSGKNDGKYRIALRQDNITVHKDIAFFESIYLVTLQKKFDDINELISEAENWRESEDRLKALIMTSYRRFWYLLIKTGRNFQLVDEGLQPIGMKLSFDWKNLIRASSELLKILRRIGESIGIPPKYFKTLE